MSKIGFIGTGNLAQSIIKGLRKSNAEHKVYLYDLMKEKADALAEQYHGHSHLFSEVVTEAEVLILAVKPKDIKKLLKDLSAHSVNGKLIISAAAGIGLSVYEQALPGIGIVRVMPNTSSAVLQAVTGMVKGKYVQKEQVMIAENIFSVLGEVIWVEDNKMNALTAVSGSGPAYFYLFTEFMSQAGIKLGLTKEESDFLARETLVGAGKMLAEDKRSPQELREAVTSPNGTTYAALTVFIEEGLEKIIYQGMEACAERAKEMEGEYTG